MFWYYIRVGANMSRRRARTDRWVGAVVAIALFGAFPAFIVVGAKNCEDGKSGVLCAAAKFVFDDALSETHVAKAKHIQ